MWSWGGLGGGGWQVGRSSRSGAFAEAETGDGDIERRVEDWRVGATGP